MMADALERLTARLRLRRLMHEDAPALARIRSDEQVNAYIDRPKHTDADEVLAFIESRNADMEKGELFYWAVCLKETNALIGTICLFRFNADRTEAEIGYELSPDHQGNGYMLEAIAPVIAFGFQEVRLHAVHAFIHPDNLRSQRLVLKQQFHLNALKTKEEGGTLQVFTLQNPA